MVPERLVLAPSMKLVHDVEDSHLWFLRSPDQHHSFKQLEQLAVLFEAAGDGPPQNLRTPTLEGVPERNPIRIRHGKAPVAVTTYKDIPIRERKRKRQFRTAMYPQLTLLFAAALHQGS